MVIGRLFPRLCVLCLSGLLSVGCLSRKADEVAVEEAAPPPAAYPDSPSGYADPAAGPVASTTQDAPAPAPAASSPPAFELRPGEQLVPHQIESGENLSVIAAKYNASIGRIKAANGMTGTKIYAGKTIQVPTSAPPNLAMSSGTSASQPGDVYGSTGGRYGRVTSARPAATSPSVAPGAAAPGVYPSVTAPPVPPQAPSYPASPSTAPPVQVPSAPVPPSYPSVSAPTAPVAPPTPPTPPAPQPFPTPSFGNGNIQFSE